MGSFFVSNKNFLIVTIKGLLLLFHLTVINFSCSSLFYQEYLHVSFFAMWFPCLMITILVSLFRKTLFKYE